jgi:hypothetical protein
MRTLVLLVALLVSTTFAGAAEDIAAGQAVIRSQRALGRGDGATAYTFASPSIKSQYWNSEAFTVTGVSSLGEPGFRPIG